MTSHTQAVGRQAADPGSTDFPLWERPPESGTLPHPGSCIRAMQLMEPLLKSLLPLLISLAAHLHRALWGLCRTEGRLFCSRLERPRDRVQRAWVWGPLEPIPCGLSLLSRSHQAWGKAAKQRAWHGGALPTSH